MLKRLWILWLLAAFCLSVPVQANQLKKLRVSPAGDKTRVVFDLSDAPRYSSSLVDNPPRLIVELKDVSSMLGNPSSGYQQMGPAISTIKRDESAPKGVLRLVFYMTGAYKPSLFTLKPQQHYSHRLVIDFPHVATPGGSPSAARTPVTNAAPTAVTSATSAPGKPVSGRIIQASDFLPNQPKPARSATASANPGVTNAQLTSANRGSASNVTRSGGVTVKEEVVSTRVQSAGGQGVTASAPSPFSADSPRSTPTTSTSTTNTTASVSPVSTPTVMPANTATNSPAATAGDDRKVLPTANGGTLVVAIDAGHGGKDPGAIGPNGLHEKDVTLAIARQLTALINKQPRMRAVMTRNGDYFVDLDRRSEIARANKANLLISIHADSGSASARGASVWILSSKRVDKEMNKLLDQQDKHTELLGGAGKVIAESEPNPYLAQTILDLSWDNSRSEGYGIGEAVLDQIGRVAHLHKDKPVHASLAVLKAPDIPSLLIETGFISNPSEARLLGSSQFQQSLAHAIFRGVQGYYADNPRTSPTRVAATGSSARGNDTKHVVKSGESLTGLAQRYGVSANKLRDYNSLKSGNLLVGQVLLIPSADSAG